MATAKRLTEKHYNGKGYYMKCSGLCHFDGHCANCDELVKIVDRLGEYEDKAKQTVDAVEVVFCDDCVKHGGCYTEDVFRLARIEKPYCCAGKMDGDGNGL